MIFESLDRLSVAVFLTLVLTVSCSESPRSDRKPVTRSTEAKEEAPSTDSPMPDVFAERAMLDVALEVEDADWSQIREEGRTLDQVYSRCREPFEYTLVPANATIDGEEIGRIAIRKKGFLGSLSMLKPSLRLELAAFQPDHTFRGVKELTLNNSRTDGSFVRQCLAYHVFASAGFAASRCGFARVHENGQDLGVYVNVEPTKKRMLRRFFESDEGNLYEGNSSSDFREVSIDFFEKKNDDQDKSDLEAVRLALDEPDDATMLEKLEPILDVDGYLRFWAVESLVSQGDGYAGNMNNFYIYHDPKTDKLVFIPWGTDGTFAAFQAVMTMSMDRPPVTLAAARLPRRLYAYEVTRERYYEAMRDVLETVWDEAKLIAEIDQMSELLGDSAPAEAIETLKEFVRGRRETAERELNATSSTWTFAERAAPVCNKAISSQLTASFSTTWGTLETPTEDPDLVLDIKIDGEAHRLKGVKVAAGQNRSVTGRLTPTLRLIAPLADGNELVIAFQMPMYSGDALGDMPLHGLETFGNVQVGKEMAYASLGPIGGGKITFDAVSTNDGEKVSGHIAAEFTQRNPSPMPISQPND